MGRAVGGRVRLLLAEFGGKRLTRVDNVTEGFDSVIAGISLLLDTIV